MNSLVVYEQFDKLQAAAVALHKSGYFKDVSTEAQAIVKVMAGAELGLPPFASMSGIHIIAGRPAIGANVIATLIQANPVFSYQIREITDAACRIEFFERGHQSLGVSVFTVEDAKRAGTQNMNKFPKNMLFARAISNGARWYCPSIFGGSPIYTPEELGAETDEDGYVVMEAPKEAHIPKKAASISAGTIVTDTKTTPPVVHEVEPESIPVFHTGDEVMVMGKNDEKLGVVTAPSIGNGKVTVEIGGESFMVSQNRLSLVPKKPTAATDFEDLFGSDSAPNGAYQD